MPKARSDKFKGQLWNAWYDTQKIMKTLMSITLNQQTIDELCEQVGSNNGLIMQATLQLDDLKDSIAQVANVLNNDIQAQLRSLHDQIDSDPHEEVKQSEIGEQEPLMVIAENNQLNQVDLLMQQILKEEQEKLKIQGYRAEFPPFFRDKDMGKSNSTEVQTTLHQDRSFYCSQMAYKLFTGRTCVKKVQKGNDGVNEQLILNNNSNSQISDA